MITSPTLVLDSAKARRNIQKMKLKADKLNLELRPHFKTHQSHEIGAWFREKGVKGITVSSITMAEYFVSDGWDNITIAFPVNVLEAKRLDVLASKIDVRVLATDEQVLKKLNEHISNEIGIYIELDPGYNRSGIPILDFRTLKELKAVIQLSKNLRFEGFYTHAGHSYKCRSKKEIEELISPILNDLTSLKQEFDDPICFGDTPSCSVLEDFGVIDQASPGNFVFFDWTQFKIGSCGFEDIAVAMYCPVVAKYPERNELLIHGGAVHFSKDSFTDESGVPYFGVIAEKADNGWGNIVPGVRLKSVSQEHGIIQCTSSYFNHVNIGDVIPIIPIHSCLTADLMGDYLTTKGENIVHLSAKKIS
ncbi:MAG: alanine racemase [Balneola sp.]